MEFQSRAHIKGPSSYSKMSASVKIEGLPGGFPELGIGPWDTFPYLGFKRILFRRMFQRV